MSPPSGRALIVTGLSVDFFQEQGQEELAIFVGNSSCTSLFKEIGVVDAPLVWNGTTLVQAGGVQQLPISPGIAIPAADRLCAGSEVGSNEVMASGYSVTSSTVTAPHVGHAVPKLLHH
jgi:hypothetical protein